MKAILTFMILILLSGLAIGQQSADILAKRQSTEEAIKVAISLLEETRRKETISLNKIKLISAQINNRTALIKNLQEEYDLLDELTRTNTEIVTMLKEDLDLLKEDFGSLMRMSQKNRNMNSVVIFILSSENLNQAYKRLQYMRQYTNHRKQQMEIINSLSDIIGKKTKDLQHQRERKLDLIQAKQRENILLQRERTAQDQSIEQLRKNRSGLMTTLREQEKIQDELDRMITKILEEQESGSGLTFKLHPDQKLLDDDFKKNKGRLPWPVERGIIVGYFGVSSYPHLNNVPVKNNGIDIATELGSIARAVFPGEVSRIFTVTGAHISVILRHGSFMTTYSNLSNIYVRVGQKVDLKQELGAIYSDPEEGKTILKFQVWEENRKQNPQEWLAIH